MSSATIKHRKRHGTTQFAFYMNYFFWQGDPRLHDHWFHTLELDTGQAGVETVQECLKYDHLVVAMKIQQRFHTHRCTMAGLRFYVRHE